MFVVLIALSVVVAACADVVVVVAWVYVAIVLLLHGGLVEELLLQVRNEGGCKGALVAPFKQLLGLDIIYIGNEP